MLDRYDKGTKIEEVRAAFGWARELGLSTLATFVLGLPGETRESLQQTLDLALEIEPTFCSFNVASPRMGTELRHDMLESGMIRDEEDQVLDSSRSLPVFSTPELTAEEVAAFRQLAIRKFYLRPSYMMRRLRRLGSFVELQNHLGNGLSLLPQSIQAARTRRTCSPCAAPRRPLRELTRLNHYSNGMSPSFYPVNGGANDWLYFYYHHIPGVTVFPFVIEVGDDLDGLWPSTARILPLAAGNRRANIFAAWAGGAFPKLRQTIVSDSSGDGDLEAGEAFRVQIRLHNFGQDPALMTGVSVAPRGPFLDLPSAPVVLSRMEPHADTVLTLNGRVGDGAPEGFENGIIVSSR